MIKNEVLAKYISKYNLAKYISNHLSFYPSLMFFYYFELFNQFSSKSFLHRSTTVLLSPITTPSPKKYIYTSNTPTKPKLNLPKEGPTN